MWRLLPEELETLWTLFTAPVVWAVHFLVCYVGAAIFCEKPGFLGADFYEPAYCHRRPYRPRAGHDRHFGVARLAAMGFWYRRPAARRPDAARPAAVPGLRYAAAFRV